MKKLSVKFNLAEQIIGWIYFVFQLLGLGLVIVVINMLLGNPLSMADLNIVSFVINFAAIVAIFHRYLWGNLKTFFAHFWKNLGWSVLGFIAYWVMNILISLLIYAVDPEFANANDDTIMEMLQTSFWPLAICTVLLVPITEEVLYRGLIFGNLYNRSKIIGFVVSTLLFASIHVVPYLFTHDISQLALAFLQYLPAGLVLGFVYGKSDSIFTGTLIHMIINLIGVAFMR